MGTKLNLPSKVVLQCCQGKAMVSQEDTNSSTGVVWKQTYVAVGVSVHFISNCRGHLCL